MQTESLFSNPKIISSSDGINNYRKLSDQLMESPQHSINESFSVLTLNSSYSGEPLSNYSVAYNSESGINAPKPLRGHKKSSNNSLLNTSMPVINELDSKRINQQDSVSYPYQKKNYIWALYQQIYIKILP